MHQAFTNSERANVAEVVAASEAAVEPVDFYGSDWTEGRKSPKAALHISNEWLDSWTLSLRIWEIDGLIGVCEGFSEHGASTRNCSCNLRFQQPRM